MPAHGSRHLFEMKKHLRRNMRAKRSALDPDTRSTFDRSIRQELQKLVRDRGFMTIAAYWPFDGEPDITPLFEPWMAAGCVLALPVVSGDDGHTMRFHAWQPSTDLTANRYGIFEPRGAPVVELVHCDLLLIPLVAYDADGNRLGMGQGYYDRHLEPVREESSPLRVGIAYSLQQLDALDANPWDVPLHGLVNECGWFTFTGLE